MTAVYPSLDPTLPDSTTSLTISCVPDPPTPTPPPPPTIDPLFTPPPIPTAASYTPAITTEMKDTAGTTIPDGATVSPGTGIYDIATVSGLPPGTSGSAIYQLFKDNCSVFLGNVGFFVPVVADANGVAVAPNSATFTVPGFPGGSYDWRVVYTDSAVGFVYSACGPETFLVPPPLPTSGTGNARLTCFLREPPEPGRAGYKVNVSPLPATGTVEVNVTLLISENVYEYKTVTLPPGTLQDLEFYGAYTYAWVNVVFRDDAGVIYAVVNQEGECAATPGPTPTPGPTQTPTNTPIPPTSTPEPTATLTPTNTPMVLTTNTPGSTTTPSTTATALATNTPTAPVTGTVTTTPARTPTLTSTNTPLPTVASTDTSVSTGTPTNTETPAATSPATGAPTFTQPNTLVHTETTELDEQPPSAGRIPGVTDLPNTGSGPSGTVGQTSMLLAAVLLLAAAVVTACTHWIGRRG